MIEDRSRKLRSTKAEKCYTRCVIFKLKAIKIKKTSWRKPEELNILPIEEKGSELHLLSPQTPFKQKENGEVFKLLREKRAPIDNSIPYNINLQKWRNDKDFPNKQNLREFVLSRLALQEELKEITYRE